MDSDDSGCESMDGFVDPDEEYPFVAIPQHNISEEDRLSFLQCIREIFLVIWTGPPANLREQLDYEQDMYLVNKLHQILTNNKM